jgi:hypothetical protein
MKEIKAFKNAIKQVSHETSGLMTHHVRTEAHAAGWPDHAINSLHVSYGSEGFKVHAHSKHAEEVKDLEYGNTTQRPTAAIRKAGNKTTEIESFFVKRLGKVMGK